MRWLVLCSLRACECGALFVERARTACLPSSFIFRLRDGASAWRHGIHQATMGPQGVEATLEAKRCLEPDIALEDFAVIADLFDRVVCPAIGKPQLLAEPFIGAEEAPGGWVVALQHRIDIGCRYTLLFRFDEGIENPLHIREPVEIIATDHWPQWLLGDHLRQNRVILGMRRIGCPHRR